MSDILRDIHEVSISDFLNRVAGKKVTLLLPAGRQITGKIAENIDYTASLTKMVHVQTLEGQEFFDAIIPKSSIEGFIVRVK